MKTKILKEYALANSERQVSGIGPGSTDQPFEQMAINTGDQLKFDPNVNYPFEINNNIKKRISDIFEYIINLRNSNIGQLKKEFEKALKNPTVSKKRTKKVGLISSINDLNNIINDLDNINKKLIDIPDKLSQIFSVDK